MVDFDPTADEKTYKVDRRIERRDPTKPTVAAYDVGVHPLSDITVDEDSTVHVRSTTNPGLTYVRSVMANTDGTLTISQTDDGTTEVIDYTPLIPTDALYTQLKKIIADNASVTFDDATDTITISGTGGSGASITYTVSYSNKVLTLQGSHGQTPTTVTFSDLSTSTEITNAITAAVMTALTGIEDWAKTANTSTKVPDSKLNTPVTRESIYNLVKDIIVGGTGTTATDDDSAMTVTLEGTAQVDARGLVVLPGSDGNLPAASATYLGRIGVERGNIKVCTGHPATATVATYTRYTPTLTGGRAWRGVETHYYDGPEEAGAVVYSKDNNRFWEFLGVLNIPPWRQLDPQPARVLGHFSSEEQATAHVTQVGDIVEFGGNLHRVATYTGATPAEYHWVTLQDILALQKRLDDLSFLSLPDTPTTFLSNKLLKTNAGGTAITQVDEPTPSHAIPNVNSLPTVTDTSPNLVYLSHDYSTGTREDAIITVAAESGVVGYSDGIGFPARGSINKISPLNYIVGTGTTSSFSLSQIGSFNEGFIDDIQSVYINTTEYQLGTKFVNNGVFVRNITGFPTGLSGNINLNFKLPGNNVFQFNNGAASVVKQGLYTKEEGAYRILIWSGLNHIDGVSPPSDPPTAAAQSYVTNDGKLWISGDEIIYEHTPPSITSQMFSSDFYNATAGTVFDLTDGQFVAHYTGGILQRQGSYMNGNPRTEFVTWTEAWTYIVSNVLNNAETRNLRDNTVLLGNFLTADAAAEARQEQTDNSKTYYWRDDSGLPQIFYRILTFTPTTDTPREHFFWRGPLLIAQDVYDITVPEVSVQMEGQIAFTNPATQTSSESTPYLHINIVEIKSDVTIESFTFFVANESGSTDHNSVAGRIFKVREGASDGQFIMDSVVQAHGTLTLTNISEFQELVITPTNTLNAREGEFYAFGFFQRGPTLSFEPSSIRTQVENVTVTHDSNVFLEDSNFDDLIEWKGFYNTLLNTFTTGTNFDAAANKALRMRINYTKEDREQLVLNQNEKTRAIVKGEWDFEGDDFEITLENDRAKFISKPHLITHDEGELRAATADDFDEATNTSKTLAWNGNKIKKVIKKLDERHTGAATWTRVQDGTVLGTVRWRNVHYQDYLVTFPQINDFYWDRHNGRFRLRNLNAQNGDTFIPTEKDYSDDADVVEVLTGDVTDVGDDYDDFSTGKNISTIFWDGTRYRPAILVFDRDAETITINFNTEPGYDSAIFNGATVSIDGGINTATLGTASTHDTGFTINGLSFNTRIIATDFNSGFPPGIPIGAWDLVITPTETSPLVIYFGNPEWITLPNNDIRITSNNIIPQVFNSQEDALAHVTANGQRLMYLEGSNVFLNQVANFTAPDPDHVIYDWVNTDENIIGGDSGRKERVKLWDSSEIDGFSLSNIDSTRIAVTGFTPDNIPLENYDFIIVSPINATSQNSEMVITSHAMSDLLSNASGTASRITVPYASTISTTPRPCELSRSVSGTTVTLVIRLHGGSSFDDQSDKLIIYGI